MIDSSRRLQALLQRLALLALVAGGCLGVIAACTAARSDDSASEEKQELIEKSQRHFNDDLDEPGPGYFGPDHPLVKELEKSAGEGQPDAYVEHVPAGAGTIIQTGQYPSSAYQFQNLWRQKASDRVVTVYAGLYTYDPLHGILLLVVQGPTFGKPLDSDAFLTPTNGGSVKIVGAEGDVLELEADDGTTFLFDVSLRSYLSPDTLEPLVTPAPQPVDGGSQESGLSAQSIDTIAIDMDTQNTPANTATSLGTRETCNTVGYGQTLAIDVTVNEIPEFLDDAGGLIGFEFTLNYDPEVIGILSVNTNMMLTANGGTSPITFTDSTPDQDGSLVVAAGDLSGTSPEEGAGVLARITLIGVNHNQLSALTVSDVTVQDAANNTYALDNVLGAEVRVDWSCS